MSEENIALRLKFLIENLGLTSSQFADKCDIARPTLSQLLSGRNKKISNLIIEQIHAAYPGLSVVWLLFGEGDMWQQNSKEDEDREGGPSSNSIPGSATDSSSSEAGQSNNVAAASISPKQAANCPKNPCENMESRGVGGDDVEKSKENGVNLGQDASVSSYNENVNQCLYSPEILSQLGKIREKTRKVVQITVYYDDSTFQTFYPNK